MSIGMVAFLFRQKNTRNSPAYNKPKKEDEKQSNFKHYFITYIYNKIILWYNRRIGAMRNSRCEIGEQMNDIIGYKEVEEYVLNIRGQDVILDRDVAALYGVETKEINQAVRNNANKFPERYIISLTAEEWDSLRSKFLTLENLGRGQHTKYTPRAFTEKGLYMLATILKSQRATHTTIAIVETFAKIRELSKTISQLPDVQAENQQKALMEKGGKIMAEILDDNTLDVIGDETTIEFNLAVMKVKHTIKRGKREKSTA